jgi:toxin ParE1/3/4
VTGFPCGWFSFIASDGVDVVRLLAEAQDVAAILADTGRE